MKDPLDPYDIDTEPKEPNAQDKIKRQQIQDDFIFIMRSAQGRRFMWRMLDRTGVYRTTFRPNSEMAFLEGVRSVGVSVLGDMHKWCLDEVFLMMNEMKDE
jgi:hypothetical protein